MPENQPLLNNLLGSKLSIVSPKPQTTRTRVIGVAIAGNSQLVFLDLPGVSAPRTKMDRMMVDAAWEGSHRRCGSGDGRCDTQRHRR